MHTWQDGCPDDHSESFALSQVGDSVVQQCKVQTSKVFNNCKLYWFGLKSSVELEKGYQLYRVACPGLEIYCSQISTVEVGSKELAVEDYSSWLFQVRGLVACGQSLGECAFPGRNWRTSHRTHKC